MSCIAILCDPQTGLVFAGDGVAYDPTDGTITAMVSKIILMPELECAVACVGMGGLGVEFLAVVQPAGLRDFDDLLDNFVDLAREAYLITRWRFQAAETQSTIVVGGWSNRNQRFELHRICAMAREVLDLATGEKVDDAPSWTPVHIEGRAYISSFPDPEVAERFGLGDGAQNHSAMDWVARVICGCRAISGPSRYEEGQIYQVGGFLQIAWINRKQMLTWIAHRWPETIGETVDPTLGDAMPAMPIAMP